MSDVMQRLGVALAGRYELQREVGRGGMGTVYLARDLRHLRMVAIKVLHSNFAAAVTADRFLREISIAAHLQHPHILTLIDSGEADGLLYYVMPFVEGESLRDRIVEVAGPLPVAEALRLLRDVVDALAHAHRFGVVHRDVKPENVMVSGRHALVVDFGVAKAMSDASAPDRLTSVGVSLGTPAYMAPEQVAADLDADHRVDTYAVGVMAYEMLTGQTPFKGRPQVVLAAHLTEIPAPVAQLRKDVSPELERVVMRCLEKDPARRYQSTDELLQAFEQLAAPTAGTATPLSARAATPAARRRLVLLGAVVLIAIAGVAAAVTSRARRADWVRGSAVPEIQRLAEIGVIDSAWPLAQRAAAVSPADSALNALWPKISGRVVFLTDPPGATVHRSWYRDSTWELVGTTPSDSVRVPSAMSRFRFTKPGYRTEVIAGTPAGLAGRQFVLAREDAPNPEMVRVYGAKEVFAGVIGLDHEPPVALGDFLIDRHEVTNARYKAFVDAGGYARREFWEHEFIREGRSISWQEAMRLLVDRTGRPGPATWEAGAPPHGQEDFPVGGVSWYEAAAYAKFANKMLPSVFHWERAASVGASQWVVPGSNLQSQSATRGSTFTGMSPSGAFDMAGNVREWCANETRGKRYILGGGWSDESYAFNDAYAQDPFDRSAVNGIRLMQLIGTEPGLPAATRSLDLAQRDFSKETPVGDAVYDSYRRMYDYDPTPLEVTMESRDTTPEDWVVEKVSYAAAYGGERVPAFLFLPKRHRGPYQTVLYFPGSNALHARSSADLGERNVRTIDFIVRSGRAVLHPIYKSTYERGDGLTSDYANETNYYRDHVLMWGKDVRRSLDYLATRNDIDTAKVAYYGVSWGAYLSGIMLAIEPRFKAGVLYVAGLEVQRGKPEVEPINFLPRVRIPVLMLNGKYDHFFPIESSQKPMFRLLGTPAEHKRYVVYEGGHNVPREKLIAETLSWLDKYLGVVQ